MSQSKVTMRALLCILALGALLGCATDAPKPANRPRTYLDQVTVPLTDSWNNQVRTNVDRLKSATAGQMGEQLTTRVIATLSKDGKVQTLRIAKTSGVKMVDDIALSAFRQASPLPPPPMRIVRNGVAQFSWDFNLKK